MVAKSSTKVEHRFHYKNDINNENTIKSEYPKSRGAQSSESCKKDSRDSKILASKARQGHCLSVELGIE